MRLRYVLIVVLLAYLATGIAQVRPEERAVVRRYAHGTPTGSGRWLRHWDLYEGRHLPRSAFRPAPQVDSAVLVIRHR